MTGARELPALVHLGSNPEGQPVADTPFVDYGIFSLSIWGFDILSLGNHFSRCDREGIDFRFTLKIRKRFSILYKSKHVFRGTHL